MAKENIFTKATSGIRSFFSTNAPATGGFVTKEREEQSSAIAISREREYNSSDIGIVIPNPTLKVYSKPRGVSFEKLRKISFTDSTVRICIQILKKELSNAKWSIVPKAEFIDNYNPENIKKGTDLINKVNSMGETRRIMLERTAEDLLALDAGVIERVYDVRGNLVSLNSVDGATIKPVYNIYGEMDDELAYIQVIDGKKVAEFKKKEIIYLMQNPQNDVKRFGYGLSPIEGILMTIVSSLNADLYNSNMMNEDNTPPGILDLGDISTEQAKKFVALWNATTAGALDRKIKFVWGSASGHKFTPLKQSNKDMQYAEFIDFLTRIKLTAYGLSSIDANILQDVNRATSETQREISNSRGALSIKRLFEEMYTTQILEEVGILDVEFKFSEAVSLNEKKQQAEIDHIYIQDKVIRPSDVAQREGFDAYAGDDNVDGEEVDLEDDMEGDTLKPTEEDDSQLSEDTQKVAKNRDGVTSSYYPPLYL